MDSFVSCLVHVQNVCIYCRRGVLVGFYPRLYFRACVCVLEKQRYLFKITHLQKQCECLRCAKEKKTDQAENSTYIIFICDNQSITQNQSDAESCTN